MPFGPSGFVILRGTRSVYGDTAVGVDHATNAALRVALYGRGSAAGDTPLQVNTGTLSVFYDNIGAVSDGASDEIATFVRWNGATKSLVGIARPTTFNGSTWDRQRGNVELTLLASAARTATTNSPDQTNYNARGVIVFLDVTAVPGVDTVTLIIQGKDVLSNNYRTLAMLAAKDATGTYYVVCYPGATDVGNRTDGKNDLPLPRTWRVQVQHSGSGSFTYSVNSALIL